MSGDSGGKRETDQSVGNLHDPFLDLSGNNSSLCP